MKGKMEMKRIACLMLVALLCIAGTGCAEYDSSYFEGFEGYKYDRFTQGWSCVERAMAINEDGMMCALSFVITSEDLGGMLAVTTELYDISTGKSSGVDEVYVLVGDRLYYHAPVSMDVNSIAQVGNGLYAMMHAILDSNEAIAIRLEKGFEQYDFDFMDEEIDNLKAFMRAVKESGMIYEYKEAWDLRALDELYEASRIR